jgi:hypothetical protein
MRHARAHFAEARTFDSFRRAAAEAKLAGDPEALAYYVRMHLPLVMVPDGPPWGWSGKSAFVAAEVWLDKAPEGEGASLADLIHRYLAAFGPATVADAQIWSGLRGLKAVFEAMRPKLAVFRDPKGRELFDLPRAPRPGGEVPAPVRLLPEWDNLILSHADRTRVIEDEDRKRLRTPNFIGLPTVLADGFVVATWKIERTKGVAALVVTTFHNLTRAVRAEIEAEGTRLLRFVEEDADTLQVRFIG